MSTGSRSAHPAVGGSRASASHGRGRSRAAAAGGAAAVVLPLAAVLALMAIELSTPHTSEFAYVRVALVAAVVLAAARYILLWAGGRRNDAARRDAEARLATEAGDRDATLRSMTRLEAGATMAETAQRICAEATTLPGIDTAWLSLVADDGVPRVLTASGLPPGMLVGRAAAPGVGAKPLEVGSVTVWLEWPTMQATGRMADLAVAGVVAALVAPFRWEDRLVGFVGIGTRSGEVAVDLGRRAATARELAVVAAASLGPEIASQERARRGRAEMDDLISGETWWPVFQPIAEIATGRVVGYEALTRFADGRPPEATFSASREAGRGLELECATLTRAIADAAPLDPDCYISLNVSPDLAIRPDLLGHVVVRPGREVLLEITEHLPIADYESLVASLYALDAPIRIAVDDAGAGYAGLQQILAIRPHVVKLDVSLVRSVDTDFARQALITGMAGFTARIGAKLLAEGVETWAEVEMLKSLGVALMQGYIVGRPERAGVLAAAGGSAIAVV